MSSINSQGQRRSLRHLGEIPEGNKEDPHSSPTNNNDTNLVNGTTDNSMSSQAPIQQRSTRSVDPPEDLYPTPLLANNSRARSRRIRNSFDDASPLQDSLANNDNISFDPSTKSSKEEVSISDLARGEFETRYEAKLSELLLRQSRTMQKMSAKMESLQQEIVELKSTKNIRESKTQHNGIPETILPIRNDNNEMDDISSTTDHAPSIPPRRRVPVDPESSDVDSSTFTSKSIKSSDDEPSSSQSTSSTSVRDPPDSSDIKFRSVQQQKNTSPERTQQEQQQQQASNSQQAIQQGIQVQVQPQQVQSSQTNTSNNNSTQNIRIVMPPKETKVVLPSYSKVLGYFTWRNNCLLQFKLDVKYKNTVTMNSHGQLSWNRSMTTEESNYLFSVTVKALGADQYSLVTGNSEIVAQTADGYDLWKLIEKHFTKDFTTTDSH